MPIILSNIYQKRMQCFPIYTHDYFTAKSFLSGEIVKTDNTYTVHHFVSAWHSEEHKKMVMEQREFYKKYGSDEYLVEIFEKMRRCERRLICYEKNPVNSLLKAIIRRILGEKLLHLLKGKKK
jgi:hypothetical protein